MDKEIEGTQTPQKETEIEEIKETPEEEEEVIEEPKEKTPSSDKDKEIETLKKQKEHWRKKAKEAGETKKDTAELSTKDAMILMRADVHEEDIDEVVNFARYRNISISDVLKDTTMQTILANRKEERATEAAINIKGGKPTGAKKTDSQVIEELRKGGEIPKPGTPEAEQMFKARYGVK